MITRQYRINPATLKNDSQPEPTESEPSIESTETVHDYEFSRIRHQLMKWKETGIIGDKAIFYVVIGNRKYSMPYTWDQWLNLPISDLELPRNHGKKFGGLLQPGDPKTLQVLRANIREEIQKGLLSPKTTLDYNCSS